MALYIRNDASNPSTIHLRPAAPSTTDFTPLAEHQASTPSSFFGGRPVLHAHLPRCDVPVDAALVAHPTLRAIIPDTSAHVARGVAVWATSEALLLVNPATSATVAVPYPAISLHATQRLRKTTDGARFEPPSASTADARDGGGEVGAVYLQLDGRFGEQRDGGDDEDEGEGEGTLEVVVVPVADAEDDVEAQAALVAQLFEALSRCADLHPDPPEDEEADGNEGGGLGTGGWITAENAHEYANGLDGADDEHAEGEAGRVFLGPGAGVRRAREEVDGDGVDGHDEVDGDEDEAKWQRTG